MGPRVAFEHDFRDPEQSVQILPVKTQSSKVRKEREVVRRRLMGFDEELRKRDCSRRSRSAPTFRRAGCVARARSSKDTKQRLPTITLILFELASARSRLFPPCLTPRPGYFLEPRRSCSRGLLLLILCGDVRCTRAVDGGAVPFARIACGRERASPTATGGCEEQAAAQASDVQGLAALDDRATDEVDSFVAGDGDAGAAGYGASVAPEGIPPSVAMAVWNSRPKTDALRDADPRDDGAKP